MKLQSRYATHCMTRNIQQRAKLLSPEFSGLILDPILQRLMDPNIEPGFKDSRYCIVFWARPPTHIRSLVDKIQQQLLSLAPSESIIRFMSQSHVVKSAVYPEINSQRAWFHFCSDNISFYPPLIRCLRILPCSSNLSHQYCFKICD